MKKARLGLCLLGWFVVSAIAHATTVIYPVEAIDDLWKLPENEFHEKYPGINATGFDVSDEGWYVRYRHQNLTYFFGPLAARDDAQKKMWELEAVRDAAVKTRPSLANSQIDFVKFTYSGVYGARGNTPYTGKGGQGDKDGSGKDGQGKDGSGDKDGSGKDGSDKDGTGGSSDKQGGTGNGQGDTAGGAQLASLDGGQGGQNGQGQGTDSTGGGQSGQQGGQSGGGQQGGGQSGGQSGQSGSSGGSSGSSSSSSQGGQQGSQSGGQQGGGQSGGQSGSQSSGQPGGQSGGSSGQGGGGNPLQALVGLFRKILGI
jgi:hypothetical protein